MGEYLSESYALCLNLRSMDCFFSVLSSLNITLGMTVFVDCAEQSIPLDARAIVAM